MYILPLDYRYGSLKHFVNGKVWVGTDNQVHDAPSHNCATLNMHVHVRIIMLKVKNLKIEQYKVDSCIVQKAFPIQKAYSKGLFNGNCVPELSIDIHINYTSR